MANAVNGSAKAWVQFGALTTTPSINASYNVSSVTYVTTGVFAVNFTTAMTDANYVMFGNAYYINTSNQMIINYSANNPSTASTCYVSSVNQATVSGSGCTFIAVGVFR